MNIKRYLLGAGMGLLAAMSVQAETQWGGLYAGGALGINDMQADWETTDAYDAITPKTNISFLSDPEATADDASAVLSAYIGYNWEFVENKWIAGIEGDLSISDNEGEIDYIPGLARGQENSSFVKTEFGMSLRGRIGYLVKQDILLYASGGLAAQDVEASAECRADTNVCNPAAGTQSNDESEVMIGYVAAFGGEFAVMQNLLIRAEYSYADLGDFDFEALKPHSDSYGADAEVSVTMQALKVGATYQF